LVAARVYRSTSLSDLWPVIAAIVWAVQLVLARRRAADLRSPCRTHRSGKPARPIASAIQLP
jgi:hypothetical protein